MNKTNYDKNELARQRREEVLVLSESDGQRFVHRRQLEAVALQQLNEPISSYIDLQLFEPRLAAGNEIAHLSVFEMTHYFSSYS